MQRNKFKILLTFLLSVSIFLAFSPLLYAQQINNQTPYIEVTNLYKIKPDEEPVYSFLLPIIIPHLQNVGTIYNQNVEYDNQINHIFISEVFRSRLEQRTSHFNYLTTGNGIISFFQTYDKYNAQFAAQFLHIVMPVFGTNQATRRLMGTLNASLDKIFKTPIKKIGTEYISSYLLSRLDVKDIDRFISVSSAIQEIAKDASLFYDLDKDFIKAVKESLKNHIKNVLNLSETESKEIAQKNFYYLLASEIFRNIQPELKKQGQNLFTHPTIGRELTQWFESAPAFSNHSIIGVNDKDLLSLNAFLYAGNKVQFAVDLDFSMNKDKNDNQIWNPQYDKNTIEELKKSLFDLAEHKVGDFYMTFVPEKFQISQSEKAIHIEFILSKIPISKDSINTEIDNSPIAITNTTQEPSVFQANSIIETPLEKSFEMPNSNLSKNNENTKIRKLNLDTYQDILGDSYTGEDKTFENNNRVTKTPSDKQPLSNEEAIPENQDLDEQIQKYL